jgi:hypothetical protein
MKGDLNQFVLDECTKEMTNIDGDMMTLRFCFKKFRFSETKHTNEREWKKGQRQMYEFLADLCEVLNQKEVQDLLSKYNYKLNGWKYEVMKITGDPPYEEIEVLDLIDNKEFTIRGKEKVIKFLELE